MGWLKEQLEEVKEEIASWPKWQRDLIRAEVGYDPKEEGKYYSDGHDFEGFRGGCARMGCPGGDNCYGKLQFKIDALERKLGLVQYELRITREENLRLEQEISGGYI